MRDKLDRVFVRAVIVLLMTATVSTTAADNDVSLAVEGQTVRVMGVKPGGKVAFFGIGHEADGYYLRIVDAIAVIEDEDGDGVVRFDIGRRVPAASNWAVVDVGRGKSTTHIGEGRRGGRKSLPAASFRRRSANAPAALVFPQEVAIVCLVRPGVGVWMRTVHDSGPTDGDGMADGVLTARTDDMRPVDKKSPPPPDDFLPGDLVFTLDPYTLEIGEGVWSANGQ